MNQKDKIVKKIIKLAENCSDPFVLGKRRSKIHSSEDIAFGLIDDYADIFDEISRELLQKERWIEKFSEKYIDEQINKIIIKIIRDENSEKALEYFDQLVTEVEQYSKEHIVYVPLFGIELPNDPVKIGNITLKRMNDTEVEGLLEKLESIVLGTEGTTESKQKNFEFQRDDINEYIKDKVCAEFKVVAEPGRSLERAEEESQRVIDIFRYAIPALYSSKDKQVVIGLQGEFSRQLRHAVIISADLDSYHSA